MTQTIRAHYDGTSLVPDDPVELSVGQRVLVRIETLEVDKPRFESLLDLAADVPDAPSDLSSQHDHYLYGLPKK